MIRKASPFTRRVSGVALPGYICAIGLLLAGPAGADSPDRLEWRDLNAWSCAHVVLIEQFPVVGEFQGRRPQEEYVKYFATRLSKALQGRSGITEAPVVDGREPLQGDIVLQGEFQKLTTGSRAKRFWLGFGAGQSGCEVRIRGLSLPGREPVFELEHWRGSAGGLKAEEIIENIDEVIDDIVPALLMARKPCQPRPSDSSSSLTGSRSTPLQDLVPFAIDSAPPNAEVYVDGNLVGMTPLPDFRLPPGSHAIEVRRQGHAAWRRSILAVAGSPSRLFAELEVGEPGEPPTPVELPQAVAKPSADQTEADIDVDADLVINVPFSLTGSALRGRTPQPLPGTFARKDFGGISLNYVMLKTRSNGTKLEAQFEVRVCNNSTKDQYVTLRLQLQQGGRTLSSGSILRLDAEERKSKVGSALLTFPEKELEASQPVVLKVKFLLEDNS